jgi:ribosomal small subunit protein bTHX
MGAEHCIRGFHLWPGTKVIFSIDLKIRYNHFTLLYYKEELMGKGDRRSRRGKLFSRTYGNKRPRKKTNKPVVKSAA